MNNNNNNCQFRFVSEPNDKQRIKIVSEPDDCLSDDNLVKYMKKITGNDANFTRKLYCDNSSNQIKPLFKIITHENEIKDSIKSIRSRKSYQIRESVWNSNTTDDDETSEFDRVLNLFEIPSNIMDFDDNNEYLVVLDNQSKCFYLKNIINLNLYRVDLEDIEYITYSIYGPTHTHKQIKSIQINKTKSIKLNYGPDIISNPHKLSIKIFKAFVENNFDTINTIIGLSL